MPCPSAIGWRFEPARPWSTGDGPCRSPFQRPDGGGVDRAARPVELRHRGQLSGQDAVQPLAHPGIVPVPQPTPARPARAEAELLGQVLPLEAGVQGTKDPPHSASWSGTVRDRGPEASFMLRQHGLQAVPQLAGHGPQR